MMRVHFIEHVSWEKPAYAGQIVHKKQLDFQSTQLHKQQPLPKVDDFDMLVTMGGNMGSRDTERFPWIENEKALLRNTVDAGKPILGICLGAQLLAEVLGAEVHANPHKEIGWFPVEFDKNALPPMLESWPEQATVLHWHQDTFTMPENAIPLGRSEACPHQGFMVDKRFVGLQFHMEFTPEHLTNMINASKDELLEGGPYVQTEEAIRKGLRHLYDNHQMLTSLMELLFETAARQPA